MSASHPLPVTFRVFSSLIGSRIVLFATFVASVLLWSAPLPSVEPGAWEQHRDGWNHPEALDLAERGRQARHRLSLEGDLETYRALTEGHIYFFVDPEEGRRSLIRVDQVAVELQWQAPDRVRQRVVGERSETRLPVRDFRYYLDRLTLVQYGFGDEIRVGSGMDVDGVPHPLAPLPDGDPERAPYDYRITDSLSLSLPGRADPIRLTELEVRPRDPGGPGVLGTMLLERATGHIVRMSFTFTPASYVDRRTDRIEVEVDYGLWEERYWLPNSQRIEVRRELPEIDLGVGTVIRAVLRVGDYELNVPVSPQVAIAPPVVWAPEEDREAYEFSEGLLERIEEDGLAGVDTRADPRALRARATELLANRPPTGLSPLRLHLPGISSAVRYNRAEATFVGLGGTVRPSARIRLRAHGGYAFGPDRIAATARVDGVWSEDLGWALDAYHNEHRDLGVAAGADPIISSLGAVIRGEDYRDPFRTSGAEVSLFSDAAGHWRLVAALGLRRDRSLKLIPERAPLDRARPFRPIRPVADQTFLTGRVEGSRPMTLPAGGHGALDLSLSFISGGVGGGIEPRWEMSARWSDAADGRDLEAGVVARSWIGRGVPQAHRLFGGRGTVPGYRFRSWAGRDLVVGQVEAATDLGTPLIRARAGLHAGWAGRGLPGTMEDWDAVESNGLRPSASLGLGLGWDLVRIKGARGLRDGEWQLLISLDPRWWNQL